MCSFAFIMYSSLRGARSFPYYFILYDMTRLSGADAQVLLHRNNDSAERRAGAVRRNDFFEMVSQKWIIKKKHTRTYVRTV